MALRSWRNILIHAKEIFRIVFVLDFLEPRISLVTEGIADEICTFAMAGEVEVESAGRMTLHGVP